MTNPESDMFEQTRGIHASRLNELISLGIYDLIIQNVKPLKVEEEELTGLSIKSEFQGVPVVQLEVIRTKQGKEFFYSEHVDLIYDGNLLKMRGASLVYEEQIPTEEEVRTEIIGKAIRDAFDSPRRKIIDPREIM